MKKFQNRLQHEKRMGASEVQVAPESSRDPTVLAEKTTRTRNLHTMEGELSYWFIMMLSAGLSLSLIQKNAAGSPFTEPDSFDLLGLL